MRSLPAGASLFLWRSWKEFGDDGRNIYLKPHIALRHLPDAIRAHGAPECFDVGADELHHSVTFGRPVERNSNFREPLKQVLARMRRAEACKQVCWHPHFLQLPCHVCAFFAANRSPAALVLVSQAYVAPAAAHAAAAHVPAVSDEDDSSSDEDVDDDTAVGDAVNERPFAPVDRRGDGPRAPPAAAVNDANRCAF